MVNAPAFTSTTPKAFLSSLKLLARTTDKAPRAKEAWSAVLHGAKAVIEKLVGESATLKGLGGHPEKHILGESLYTAAPLLYGPYFAKLSVAPVSHELAALTDLAVDLDDKPKTAALSLPTSTTSPRSSPDAIPGIKLSNRCRSDPQMAQLDTFITASRGCSICGSGTVS
jgi:hypothetical protein